MLANDPFYLLFEAIYNRLNTSHSQFTEVASDTAVRVIRDYGIPNKQWQVAIILQSKQRLIVLEYRLAKPEVFKRLMVDSVEEDRFTWSFAAFSELWSDIVTVDMKLLKQRMMEKF